jgi:hypothetical protein
MPTPTSRGQAQGDRKEGETLAGRRPASVPQRYPLFADVPPVPVRRVTFLRRPWRPLRSRFDFCGRFLCDAESETAHITASNANHLALRTVNPPFPLAGDQRPPG